MFHQNLMLQAKKFSSKSIINIKKTSVSILKIKLHIK
jgi:hypothetical protein